MTRFVGVSAAPGEGIGEGVGPYEFFTDRGVRVFLHDTDYLGLRQTAAAELRLYFGFDPEWTPAELKDTSVVMLVFTDVDYRPHPLTAQRGSWADGPDRFVYSFDWDGSNGFALDTSEIKLAFTAAQMTVELLSAEPAGLQLRP